MDYLLTRNCHMQLLYFGDYSGTFQLPWHQTWSWSKICTEWWI